MSFWDFIGDNWQGLALGLPGGCFGSWLIDVNLQFSHDITQMIISLLGTIITASTAAASGVVATYYTKQFFNRKKEEDDDDKKSIEADDSSTSG